MTILDKRFGKLATNLIGKYGKNVTFTNVSVGEYNTESGSVINASTSITIKALVEDYSLHNSGTGFASGLIMSGDKKFSIAAAGITKPKPGDKIILDGVVYLVARVTETWSGERIAMYEVQGRI